MLTAHINGKRGPSAPNAKALVPMVLTHAQAGKKVEIYGEDGALHVPANALLTKRLGTVSGSYEPDYELQASLMSLSTEARALASTVLKRPISEKEQKTFEEIMIKVAEKISPEETTEEEGPTEE